MQVKENIIDQERISISQWSLTTIRYNCLAIFTEVFWRKEECKQKMWK